MHYTQVELSLNDISEVWWLPVPEGKAKVGEQILHKYGAEWTITQVCVTLDESGVPWDARVARGFVRETPETKALMYIS